MPSQPISTSVAYASAADLIARHDFRQLGDVMNDDGTRMTSEAAFAASSKTTAALLDASGMVEMYTIRGNKYSVSDLQSLTGAGRNLLIKLVVELAWWALFSRRQSRQQMSPEAMWAFSVLDDLASGAKIFPLVDQADAGNPLNGVMTSADWQYNNFATNQASRYYGVRAKYREPNGGGAGGDDCGCG